MNMVSNNPGSSATQSAASAAKNKAGNGAAHGEFYNFIHDIEDLIKAMTSLSGEDLERARAKLNERVLAAKESVDKMSHAITEKARNTAKTTNTYVHKHPWKALGMGAVLGLLIGAVIARR